MSIKEKLAAVDKRIWIGIACAIVTILICCFFVFNAIGKFICYYFGLGFLVLLTIVCMLKMYFVILKKMGFVKENPIYINFEFKIKKPVKNDVECTVDNVTANEQDGVEAEISLEDTEP